MENLSLFIISTMMLLKLFLIEFPISPKSKDKFAFFIDVSSFLGKGKDETSLRNTTLSFVLGKRGNTTRKSYIIIIVPIRKILNFSIYSALFRVIPRKDDDNLK